MYVDKHKVGETMENKDYMYETSLDFFLFSLIGITSKDAENFELLKFACINRAYLDAARRVLHENNKDIRRAGVNFLMENISIDQIYSAGDLIDKLCNKVSYLKEKIGISQKWVNMTYKYMIATCSALKINISMCEKLISAYKVPVDSVILSVINDKRMSWSQLDHEQYKYVDDRINNLADKYFNRYLWENSQWLQERHDMKDSIINKYEDYKSNYMR